LQAANKAALFNVGGRMSNTLELEVAYGTDEKQWLLSVQMPVGSTVLEAVEASGLFEEVPALREQELVVGVFGQRLRDHEAYELRQGDRIEVYRPLLIDPMQARRDRAKQRRRSS